MAERLVLLQIAGSVIRRVYAESNHRALTQSNNCAELCEALNRAYPFGDSPGGRDVWLEALIRDAVCLENPSPSNNSYNPSTKADM